MPAISIVLVPDVLNADGSGMYYGNANQVDSFTIKNITPGHYRAWEVRNVDDWYKSFNVQPSSAAALFRPT